MTVASADITYTVYANRWRMRWPTWRKWIAFTETLQRGTSSWKTTEQLSWETSVCLGHCRLRITKHQMVKKNRFNSFASSLSDTLCKHSADYSPLSLIHQKIMHSEESRNLRVILKLIVCDVFVWSYCQRNVPLRFIHLQMDQLDPSISVIGANFY